MYVNSSIHKKKIQTLPAVHPSRVLCTRQSVVMQDIAINRTYLNCCMNWVPRSVWAQPTVLTSTMFINAYVPVLRSVCVRTSWWWATYLLLDACSSPLVAVIKHHLTALKVIGNCVKFMIDLITLAGNRQSVAGNTIRPLYHWLHRQ